jgi:hypothetical protein
MAKSSSTPDAVVFSAPSRGLAPTEITISLKHLCTRAPKNGRLRLSRLVKKALLSAYTGWRAKAATLQDGSAWAQIASPVADGSVRNSGAC